MGKSLCCHCTSKTANFITSILLLVWGGMLSQSFSGTVMGSDGIELPGATLLVVETQEYTTSDFEGRFTLNATAGMTVEVSFLGYDYYQFVVDDQTNITIQLIESSIELKEVVVIGYGHMEKKDLTGSIASIQEKDFNKGNFASPDKLIQGRVAGVQITQSSGQPGVAATIKIRGNSVITGNGQPLFVVDGVPLSGTTSRPNDLQFTNGADFGTSPSGNLLNFINAADIASIDILKDASAAAIYGARAAYGVVIITTKKGLSGEPKIDFDMSMGFSTIQNRIKVLDANQYRDAIQYYNVNPQNDKGGDSDALGTILRTGKQQNYNVGISGGTDNAKYRLSIGYLDQEGILNKSEIKKYSGNLSTNFKFLESKTLGIDINLIASQYKEQLPYIRNEVSIVGDALAWNPTEVLRSADGSFNLLPGGNPLARSELYDDSAKVTTIFAGLSPYYEITDWLEFKMLANISYGTGIRRNSTQQGLYFNDIISNNGLAKIYNNEDYSNQLSYTLTFHKDILPLLKVTAVGGFEYLKFTNKGSFIGVTGPLSGFGNFGLDYTDYIQYSNPDNRNVFSFIAPITELQSYFTRGAFIYNSKYLATITIRADGSSKFGAKSKYGYFPSFSMAWITSEEDFFKIDSINYLKVRVGWGRTGNQEFPSGSSTALYGFTNNGGYGQVNNPNPNLKWQADEQSNIGVDFTILNHKISGTFDYFKKTTTDLLYPSYPIQPAPPGSVVTWINLDGKIQNSGLETTINASIIDHEDITWDFGFNASFLKNNVSGLKSPIPTGALDGPGMSGVTVQKIQSGVPMNTFFTRKYLEIDPITGLAVYQDNGNTFYNVGNPNPTAILGINSTFRLKKLSLSAYMYGAFGQSIYNNTLNSTLNVGNIGSGKNIALSVYQNPIKEALSNPVTPSSRFIEKGDYLKMGNVTLGYDLGKIGKSLKQTRIYVTGQNLFTITKYSGFDPEVNIDKNINGVPSLGIDYQAYPSAISIITGFNFSL